PRVPSGLQRRLIGRAQARGELTDPFRRGGERAGLRDLPVLPDRYLREITVHIQPDTPPLCPAHPLLLLPQMTSDRERVSKATPTDPRAQRNRAGRRGGHLLTRALSPPCKTGLPTLLHFRRPCPGRSHRMPATHPRKGGQRREPAAPGIFILVTTASSRSTPGTGGRPKPEATSRPKRPRSSASTWSP